MKFRTQIPFPNNKLTFSHQENILSMGSCFAQNIGQKFSNLKFPTLVNPFGILYNPISLSDALNRIILKKHYTEQDLVEHNGLWHSFDHHSHFSHPNASKTVQQINTALSRSIDFLQKTER